MHDNPTLDSFSAANAINAMSENMELLGNVATATSAMLVGTISFFLADGDPVKAKKIAAQLDDIEVPANPNEFIDTLRKLDAEYS